jgi:hypothetical protein
MSLILKLVEKIFSSLLVTLLFTLVSFSYLTGKFPPSKEDLRKSFHLAKEILLSSKNPALTPGETSPAAPNLEQVISLQRLALKRSESVLQLTQILRKLPQGAPSLDIAEELQRAESHLTQVDQALTSVQEKIKSISEAQ